ncbi:CRISPR-associated helicase Cas3' [Solwaraspora sp. WMMD792]|uniref:CRISPR-associated helicase Cas3' n=1 Tax=Solwaraspora sp. WMMD792 TaxID=3016099 RepID=UPI002415A4EE|nr:CRISPR-associated helicase Cas3' [Solwaraspora sp. WMMD792]MDG4771246.1 CRISPR-associated helicase Cas3' [Solwaraspora sp. WMMD792]
MATQQTVELSDAASSAWGKTSEDGPGWLPLWQHLADAAAVAERLWRHWLNDAVRQRISSALPGGDADGRLLVAWLAGVHDIGKATPAFAVQRDDLMSRMHARGLTVDNRVKADRRIAPHALAGQILLEDWLIDGHDWVPRAAATFAVVVGGHHGVPPTDKELHAARSLDYLLGTGPWPAVQRELLDWMTDRCGVRDRLSAWRDVRLPQPVQALLTGIVVVADWIASNQELFPTTYAADVHRVERAWDDLDLPSPWRAVDLGLSPDAIIATRFGLPAGATAYPVQRAVIDQARRMAEPGLMIVEAPMGDGKTEAALAAVEILAARFGLSGCFVALPTRATSDAMLSRGLSWMERLPDRDADRGAYGVALAHGKSSFNNEYDTLRIDRRPSSIGVDEEGVQLAVHRWLASRKKILLSDFVVGTVDQLLFMALKARYVVLRHLGLAGKVVVVDEAHAYDVHMSQYLDRALEWLAAYRVPVIVLSATLPARRRRQMMMAYDDGRFGQPTQRQRRRRTPASDAAPGADTDPYADLAGDIGYPVITCSGATDRQPAVTTTASSGRAVQVRVSRFDDDPQRLADLLADEIGRGGCALVVRNTVRRVQETAAVLRRRFGTDIPVFVAHSRFLAPDRAANDRRLLDMFGPPSRVADRPERYVVVSSQVAEVSLDVDFDLLVTDLAPVDLLLQRMGRLHRHHRSRPAHLATPRCLITGADWSTDPPEPVQGSRIVYGRAGLWRAAGVLWPHLDGDVPVELPADIPTLVQTAYDVPLVGPTGWHPAMREADEAATKRQQEHCVRADAYRLNPVSAQPTALLGWLVAHIGDADAGGDDARGRGHVRSDSAESLEVILLVRRDGRLHLPDWVPDDPGREVPTEMAPDNRLARSVARCTLALPQLMTSRLDEVIDELEARNCFPAWDASHWLAGELVLDIDDTGRTQIAGFDLHYDNTDGLIVTKLDASLI